MLSRIRQKNKSIHAFCHGIHRDSRSCMMLSCGIQIEIIHPFLGSTTCLTWFPPFTKESGVQATHSPSAQTTTQYVSSTGRWSKETCLRNEVIGRQNNSLDLPITVVSEEVAVSALTFIRGKFICGSNKLDKFHSKVADAWFWHCKNREEKRT